MKLTLIEGFVKLCNANSGRGFGFALCGEGGGFKK
jgi:hypothetical protein